MSCQEQERTNRFRRREAERWRARRAEVMEENRSERNDSERDGRFRHLMVSLTRRASSGNPPRAVSSAVSRPEHMCQALCYVLSSMFSVTGPFATQVHFSIQGSVLTIKKFCATSNEGVYYHDMTNRSRSITVSVGWLQRASRGCESDHDCEGLCCTDARHGVTKITCPPTFDMS
jgi:hypothetical protein